MLFAATLLAQTGEVEVHSGPYHFPNATMFVETRVVELVASVTNHKGASIGGLTKSDFVVLDNLKQQEITSFREVRRDPAPGSDEVQPRYLALYFDDTHSGPAGFDRSRKAARKLISEGLRPGEHVGIFTSSGVDSLDFTSDAKAILDTLVRMRLHPLPGVQRSFGACPVLTTYQAYAIASRVDRQALEVAAVDVKSCSPEIPWEVALQQAQEAGQNAWEQLRYQSSDVLNGLVLAARRLAAAPGARILLIVSPGFVTDGMDEQIASLTDLLVKAHVVVNSLDDEGLLAGATDSPESLGMRTGPRANWADRTLALRDQVLTEFLANATGSTGGKFIHNNNDLGGALRELAVAPEFSYLVGFSPTGQPDGKYHKLKVTLAARTPNQVRTRPGYMSVKAEPVETAQQKIDRAVISLQPSNDLPAQLNAHAANGKIVVDISVDAKKLRFVARDGKSVQQLTFVTVLQDAAGNFVEGKQAVMDLALNSGTRKRLEANGLRAAASFAAPAGSYTIREVVREAADNRLMAANCKVDIR